MLLLWQRQSKGREGESSGLKGAGRAMAGYLIHSPAAWEEVAIVMAMQGDVEHSGVLVEGLLGAVAVVNILRGRWAVD